MPSMIYAIIKPIIKLHAVDKNGDWQQEGFTTTFADDNSTRADCISCCAAGISTQSDTQGDAGEDGDGDPRGRG